MKKKMEVAAPFHLHTVVNDQVCQQDHGYVTPGATRRRPLAAARRGSDPENGSCTIPPRLEHSMETRFSGGREEEKQKRSEKPPQRQR